MSGKLVRDTFAAILIITLTPGLLCGSSAAQTDDLGALMSQVYQLDEVGRYQEAIPIAQHALSVAEHRYGIDHAKVADPLLRLGRLYRAQGLYTHAEPTFKRALAINQKALGPGNRETIACLENLAQLYQDQGRFAEAEPLYRRALAALERSVGSEDFYTVATMNNLAGFYGRQGRYSEAEGLFQRVLAIDEKVHGRSHAEVAYDLNNLAVVYGSQGRLADAESLHKRALDIRQKVLRPEHPLTIASLHNLAFIYGKRGRYTEAEPMMKRALSIREKSMGPDHPEVGQSLSSLAWVYQAQGRYAEAEPLYKRALAIKEKAFGPEHPDVAFDVASLAVLALAQRDWELAAEYWRRATQVIERRSERGLAASDGGSGKGEAVRNSWYFSGLVKMTDRLAPQGADRARPGKEMFETAQWAQASDAASSLTQMAARSAKGDTALATLVRERQDLVGEWQGKDKQLIAAKSHLPAERGPDAEKVLSDRLAAIDGRLKAIDARFAKDFPEFASLTSPKPASAAEVQALLQPNEALVLFLDTDDRFKPTPEETFIWIITKDDMRWEKSELGTKALTNDVAALRCGLDAALWDDVPAAARCRSFVKTTPGRDTYGNVRYETLPFDTTRANALYEALFGPIADVITDKHLLIVPSGALTQLPFQVLITNKPDPALSGTEALRRAAWFARSHALTILPSVSSLKALRQFAKESHANRSLIGFGNPLLDGRDARYAALAAAARSKTSCPELAKQQVAELTGKRRGVLPLSLRSGLADAGEIRSQVPLPETADELCAVARDLRVSNKDIWLGNRATEAEIKRLSEAGDLAKYRIVHFATHGALAGQVGGNSEPGLILTPPNTATERDDGYLSASEITTLKLDADWVILSACNTAAGGAEGAEALSGLARAFFYAGARALLVSHWAVASDATVKLITGAVKRMASDNAVGRAEAMRQSMLALIDKGEAYETHPAFWAPFVVVGEGAAAR